MSHDPEDELEAEYHSREAAIALARAEAHRSYEEIGETIRYVAYVDGFYDYCLCEFVKGQEGWIKTFRALTPSERLPSEEVQDELIRKLAKSGNTIASIRLYRAKHEVGLQEAFAAIRGLL